MAESVVDVAVTIGVVKEVVVLVIGVS